MELRDTKSGEESPPTRWLWRSVLTTIYSLLVGLSGLAALGYLLITQPADLDWGAILLFTALSLLVQRSSFYVGSPVSHSLAGVIDLAAVFALGPLSGATVAGASGFVYLLASAVRHQRLSFQQLLGTPIFNAGLKVWMALASGALFLSMGRTLFPGGDSLPLMTDSLLLGPLLAILAVCLVWFTLDHLGWGLKDYIEGGGEKLRQFIKDAFPRSVFIELLPLPFGVVIALVYTRLAPTAFLLLAVFIVAFAVLVQRWARARYELVQRVAELTAVDKVGQAIAQAQLDVDEICQLVYEHACQIVDTTIFHLGLFDGENLTLRLWVREGQVHPQQTFPLTEGVGLVNWLRKTGEPILVSDFRKDSLPAQPAYISERPPRSAVFVPLTAGETMLGTMSIQSYQPNAYGESDLRVLSAMANQAAVAVQKARLYNQERKRARQLETIGQVSRQVSAILELDQLFEGVVRLIRESFGYYHVALYTTDKEAETVTLQTSSSAGQRDVALTAEWGQGLIGWAAAHSQPVMVNDVDSDTRYRCIEALEETRSELVVPLMVEQVQVAILDVQSDEVDAFSEDDLFILDTLGQQVAIAIQEARLYDAERQQAWFSTVLLQVAEAASRLSDMDEVLATIVRLVPLLAGVDRCAILLWDPETETFVPAQVYGLVPGLRDQFERALLSPQSVPFLDLIRRDPHPVILNGQSDEALIPRELVEAYDIQEMLLLPLLAQAELLGAMMVDYGGRDHSFGERVVHMLSGIANQAATVIQSARLVQAQREEAYISMALLQVADTVSRFTRLDETMASIVRVTPMLVGVEASAIYLLEEKGEVFVPAEQYGLRKEVRSAFWQQRLEMTDPVVRGLLEGEPIVSLADAQGDVVTVPVHQSALASLAEDTSLLALPLLVKGQVLGLMLVDSRRPVHSLSGRWVKILTGIAGQAAVAVENARLLKEAAEQERMQQELEVARRIQTSFLPETYPLTPGWEFAVVWRSARQVGGDFYDFVHLPFAAGQPGAGVDRTGVVIADVADKGVPAALFMALSRTLLRTMAIGGRSPSTVVAQTNDLILADARAELFVTLFYTVLEPNSGEITYVNAGHMPPLLVRAVDGTAEELRAEGMALAVLPGIEFEQRTAHLAPQDLLILYTDGVIEASNSEQEMFGRERLLEVVRDNRSLPAQDLSQTIDDVIDGFVGDAAQFDDFTLVVAKRVA